MVADGECLTDIVVRDEHADVAVAQKTYDALNLNHGNRINTSEGFIQENEPRISCKGTGDFCAAAFAARE